MTLREDAQAIIDAALFAAQPDEAVKNALHNLPHSKGKLLLIAAGKAAWQMAKTAMDQLDGHIDGGVVVTKYGHSRGELPGLITLEAGHPMPDENSFHAAATALSTTDGLTADDTVLFLLSGGGSALFESPLCSPAELQDITRQLLACGADIVEINIIRKRLSAVKGGRFALHCTPARVFSVVLSDIVGDPLDMIASGPAYPDTSTCAQAVAIAEKYRLHLSDAVRNLLQQETPKALDNVETHITGSVRQLCAAAEQTAAQLGYEPLILTDCLQCEAREAGRFLAAMARYHRNDSQSLAIILGGETIVHLTGTGKGGRNQELALAAAEGIAGLEDTAVFSVGSDGTDGPTDAAGGYVDGSSQTAFHRAGFDIEEVLRNNDAYHALQAMNGLIVTGPTGTNVNDLSVLLLRRN